MLSETGENVIDLRAYARPAASSPVSPFRYPGGKGFLTAFLLEEIRRRFGERPPAYAEPYCGGAGAALNLLTSGSVSKIYLNDADHRIYSSWSAMLHETDRFLARIEETPVTLATWDQCVQKVHESQTGSYDFDVGFATFFINRTSRSGVVLGSGPIGGYGQDGPWKISARFNKDGLSERIRKIGEYRSQINLSCTDGLEFCKNVDAGAHSDPVFFFIDPPYVGAGGRLYYNGMTEEKHEELSTWLRLKTKSHWVLTYDDHPIVRQNYDWSKDYRIQVRYSLGARRLEKELLFMSIQTKEHSS
jgi:DNA adenine methylase